MALRTAVGGRESNSFVTVEESDAIVILFPDDPGAEPVEAETGPPVVEAVPGTGWLGKTEDQKEFRLVLAAHAMDLLMWKGRRVYCGQALCFPRTCQDNVGMNPEEIKQLQVFIAYSVIDRALAARPEIADGEVGSDRVTSVSLGGMLAVSFGGDVTKTGTLLDRLVKSPQFPGYLMVMRYVTQVRGRVVTGDEFVCSTTTTSTTTTSTTTTSTTTSTT